MNRSDHLAAGDDLNCVGSSNIVQSLLSTTLSRRRSQTRSFTKNNGGYPIDRPRGFVTLETKNLSLSVMKMVLLSDISAQVQPGEVLAVIGPSGAGQVIVLVVAQPS